MRLLLVASAVLALTGCDFGTLDDLAADDATEGTEASTGQARAIWRAYDKPDEDVKKALSDVEAVVAGAGNIPVQVKIGDLTAEDVAPVAPGKDAPAAQGMLVITELDCTMEQVEKLVVAKNQTTIYPDLYDKYARSYTSDVQAFLSGAAPTVTWRTDYTASALGRTYESNLTGAARRVPGAGPGGSNVLIARTYLNEPARFIAGEDAAFDQDYQIELYYPRNGKVLHFYGLWRQFRIATLTSEADLYVNIVLGNLIDFDVRTSKVCRENDPQPTFE